MEGQIVVSPLRIYVDDFASLDGHPSTRDSAAAEIVSLSDSADALVVPAGARSPAEFVGHDDVRAAIVTADARLGATAGTARRVADVGLAAVLVERPDAIFQFFTLTVPPDRTAALRDALTDAAAVPVYRSAGDEYVVVGIAEADTLLRLGAAGWRVAVLGASNLPDTYDLYLVRDVTAGDVPAAALSVIPQHGGQLLLSLPEGVVIAVPAESSIEELHLPVTTHGHNLKLLPDRGLLSSWGAEPAAAVRLSSFEALEPAVEHVDRLRELIPEARLVDLVARLSGSAPVAGSPIVSRHVWHADVARAVELLAAELAGLGLQAHRHRFVHEGVVQQNVYADIPGTGDGMIWVTAHLDSTAAREQPYRPDGDPAPGADDDGSGSAAVIAIAAALVALAEVAPPTRTIRFALFNAEEHGLVGSGHFARAAAAVGLPVDAVLQLDMIGHVPAGDDRRFEVHCGHVADPAVERRSEPLALLVAAAAKLFDGVGDAEVYRSPTDPADGRSDHTSFQSRGYPAILVSENFFGGTVTNPGGPPNNPNYHSANDVEIDAAFTTAIARAAALSAWTLATS